MMKDTAKQIELANRISHLMYFSDIQAERLVEKIVGTDAEMAHFREVQQQKQRTNNSNWKTRTIDAFKVPDSCLMFVQR